ncbi:uncharacterized protein APUU_11989S [Aspergillus puulaauensis]|uniref:Uncharacterized protein n=1 Tax=Aspergillus puulaauensis TaxID=1220207 RepID=A0A7R7XDA4_9EURO|nr:uncharacterized protein APUU_11989S [Aspergillus puulaauensis]BCS19161.1 hypothetical protein APUU_11989S [Aspergillus puulaauensis]
MSNISAPDWKTAGSKLSDWSLFDEVFVSCETQVIKPDLGFYTHVISRANTDPKTTVFINDRQGNVLPTQSLGLHGIGSKGLEDMKCQLKEICRISGTPAVI